MRKKISILLNFCLIIIILNYLSGCKKQDSNDNNLASLTTKNISSITNISVISGGNILNKGQYEIIRRGVCWALHRVPTIDDFRIINPSDSNNYNVSITGLIPKTTYYLRAYATNAAGTGYGNEIMFSTTGDSATLTTLPVQLITYTSILCGGNITFNGGDSIKSRGICWGLTPKPTILDGNISSGKGDGKFLASINGLYSNKTYYLRAYATNSVGTTYGNEISFTLWLNSVANAITDIDNNTYQTIRIGSQIWMKENLRTTKFQDGTNITKLASGSNSEQPGYFMVDSNLIYDNSYNGYVVTISKNVCPTGWHVPVYSEWDELVAYLGGFQSAGALMKDTINLYWNSTNIGATNLSGFSAEPNGYIGYGNSYGVGNMASFLVPPVNISDYPSLYTIEGSGVSVSGPEETSTLKSGGAIRCIKDL